MKNSNSGQKFISRNRAPRVQIEYAVELYGAERTVQLPFVLGVLADLGESAAQPLGRIEERKFLDIDTDNFNERMKSFQPGVSFQVADTLSGQGDLPVALTFNHMDDFLPDAVARQVEPLNVLLDAHIQLSNLLSYMDGKNGAEDLIATLLRDQALLNDLADAPPGWVVEAQDPSQDDERLFSPQSTDIDTDAPGRGDGASVALCQRCLPEIKSLLEAHFRPKTEQARCAVVQAVQTLARQVLQHPLPPAQDAFGAIQRLVYAIDQKMSGQINAILHHPDFQRLEGAWRGLHFLVNNTESSEMLKIRVMNLSKADLAHTLKRYKGASWDQSPLFKRIYEEEYGQFGGEPLGCLVGDYYFDHSPQDVELLGELSMIAAAAHCPFISGASPGVMQMETWQELSNPRDLSKIFQNTEYAAWRALRESEDARYIGLVMPRLLGRLPYGAQDNPVGAFDFTEQTAGDTHAGFIWINAAYAMAVNINRSFKEYGWCTSIRGVESGGAVDNLLCHNFPTDDGGVDMKCPTEIAISDRREAELAKNGFMPLVYRKNSDFAAFIGAQSLQKPAEYSDPDATANANLAARLPYLFACCRFAHYLKCIVRDKVGTFQSRDEMARWLNNWIINYVDGDPLNSSQQTKARRPLASAEVQVNEVADNPGYYEAKFFLRPHYQLEGLTVSLRLVSKLPSLKTGAN